AIDTPRLHLPTTAGEPYKAQVTVRNTGNRAGAEVVQVYVSLPSGSGLAQPPKRLVGFQKVRLEPGMSREVDIEIDPHASHHPFSVWDVDRNAFVMPSGEFTVWVGNASDNLTKAGAFRH